MPTRHGGKEAKKACTSSRRNFFLKTAFPAASAAWATKMRLAMSSPTVVISPMDGLLAMPIIVGLWHTDAGSGGSR